MIEKKTPEQIEKMRVVGAVVATALEEMQQAAAPGVSLKELDAVGAQVLADHGATSPSSTTTQTGRHHPSPDPSVHPSTTPWSTVSPPTN